MVNRLIEPTSGRILIDGVDAATRDVTELRRGIGYVIQQTGLFPHQTIERERRHGAAAARLVEGAPARARRGAARARRARPGRTRDRYPAQLSGGERQRVGVARALAADPPIMLMDEPFGAVDPIVRERLQNEFLRLQEQLAKTILFVTHDIDEAIKMGDLVAVFQAGGIVAQFGPPAEILAAPASEFVARFVGADRGLKRLSLTPGRRPRARAGRHGARRATTPPRRAAGPSTTRSATCCSSTRQDRPLGWVDQDDTPGVGAARRRPGRGHVRRCSTGGRRSRTRCRCSLDDDVQAGVVVDRRGALRGLVQIEQIVAFMRDTARAVAGRTPPEPADGDGAG